MGCAWAHPNKKNCNKCFKKLPKILYLLYVKFMYNYRESPLFSALDSRFQRETTDIVTGKLLNLNLKS